MIYYCDFETTNLDVRSRVHCGYLLSSVEGFLFYDIKDFVDKLNDLNKGDIIYFYNLDFDGEFIFCYLLDKGLDEYLTEVMVVGGKLISFKYRGIHFKCAYALTGFSGSLNELAKKLGLQAQKNEMTEDEIVVPFDYVPTAKMIKYLKQDVILLAQVLEEFNKSINRLATVLGIGVIDIHQSITLSGLAYKILSECTDIKNYHLEYPEIDGLVRKAYYGGYTCAFQRGIFDKCTYIDINSSYPSVLMEEWYPSRLIRETNKIEDNGTLKIIKMTVTGELREGCVPTLMCRGFKVSTKKTIMLGDELVLCCVDYKNMLENYNITNLEIHNVYEFEKVKARDVLGEYIKTLYDIKSNGGQLKFVSKLMLNSIYGKFAQNPENEKHFPVLNKHELLSYEREWEYNPDMIKNVLWGIYTTAYGRKKLFDKIKEIGVENALYCDTDSVIYKGAYINDDTKILGGWKTEHKGVTVKIIGEKKYCLVDGGYIDVKLAGFNKKFIRDEITPENFKTSFEKDVEFDVIQKQRVKGGICLVKTKKRIN